MPVNNFINLLSHFIKFIKYFLNNTLHNLIHWNFTWPNLYEYKCIYFLPALPDCTDPKPEIVQFCPGSATTFLSGKQIAWTSCVI